MTRLFVRRVLRLLACAALALSFAAPARAVTINITGSTCSWDGSTLTCNANNNGPSAPSGCALTANGTNPATLPAGGGTVSLNASCSGGGAPTSYVWSGPGLVSQTASGSQSTNITQTSDFSVTPSNTTGNGNTASVHVTVGGGGGGGGGGGSIANCTNAGYTVLGGAPINITWGQPLSVLSGAWGNSQVWLFSMTVPAGVARTAGIGYFAVAEYGGSPTTRQMFISTSPCDFTDPQGVASQGVTATVWYNTAASPIPGYADLVPNTTYFITVRNFDYASNVGTCPGNNCTATMNAQPQH